MEAWLENNIVGIVGIIISSIIAYHVFFLSRKITLKDNLLHKESIGKNVEKILQKIRQGVRRKIELINIDRYAKDYPHNNNLSRKGYSYMGAELKALRFDGVEFFCGIREAYKIDNDNYVLLGKEDKNQNIETVNLFEVGIVPYEWIKYIDLQGDEFSWRPQFFVEFRGKDKYPYKYLRYYIESEVYRKGNDPLDMQWKLVKVKN